MATCNNTRSVRRLVASQTQSRAIGSSATEETMLGRNLYQSWKVGATDWVNQTEARKNDGWGLAER